MKIQNAANEATGYKNVIKPFYYGNKYYLITKTFKDVRLVGAPPSSMGKFGGDTDNWVWQDIPVIFQYLGYMLIKIMSLVKSHQKTSHTKHQLHLTSK